MFFASFLRKNRMPEIPASYDLYVYISPVPVSSQVAEMLYTLTIGTIQLTSKMLLERSSLCLVRLRLSIPYSLQYVFTPRMILLAMRSSRAW